MKLTSISPAHAAQLKIGSVVRARIGVIGNVALGERGTIQGNRLTDKRCENPGDFVVRFGNNDWLMNNTQLACAY